MALLDPVLNAFRKGKTVFPTTEGDQQSRDGVAYGSAKGEDIFKAYIPNFLYKPPYGMPRKVNVITLKKLAANPYVFAVIKTFADEITSLPWKIRVKEEYSEDGMDYSEKIKEITKFFRNPNGNEESFEHIMRSVITGILEVDAGLIVKVFNQEGEFQQMFSRDGSTFLKNPDIYGYIGDRADLVPPLPDGFTGTAINLTGSPTTQVQQLMKTYNVLFREQAAYFQYGWTAGSMPVPFGKREVVYIMQNPRPDTIYGRSPVQMLSDIIMNLVYGSEYTLDWYTNNNMPDGVISLIGAQPAQLKQFRENWEKEFKFTDNLGKKRKRFFKVPLATSDVKFTPFQLSPRDMEIIAQQQWFSKVMWACFGVTAEEMGFTEDSNRAISKSQTSVSKRKAIAPMLNVLEYHIDTQILTEFFTEGGKLPDFSEVPLEFCYETPDLDEDIKKHTLLQMQLNMGIKTQEMVAAELGIDVEALRKSKADAVNEEIKLFGNQEPDPNQDPNFRKEEKEDEKKDNPEPEEKAQKATEVVASAEKESEKVLREIDKHFDKIENKVDTMVEETKDWVLPS